MSVPSTAEVLARMLRESYGFDFAADSVRESTRTANSTIYEASNDDGAAVQIEVFDGPAPADAAGLDGAFAAVTAPGAFRPRHAGRLEDGQLYILSEATVGTSLSELIDQKRAAGEVFTAAETRDLLDGAAQAIDAYNAAGHPEFLARSINTRAMLVQPAWSEVPVKLALVGPSGETNAAEDNLHDFWNVVAEVTARPVNEEAAAKHATAAGYLAEITEAEDPNVASPIAPATGNVAPRPQDGYRKPPEAYPAGAAAPATHAKAKRNPWPWIIGVLVVALLALAGAWWWSTHRGEEWTGANAEIAEAYPNIVSKKSGQKGWEDLTCEQAATDAGQDGKIRCAGEDLGVSVAKYSSESARDEVVPGEQYATVLGSGACMIEDYEIPDATPPAYAMAPRDKSQYLIVVNGNDAEQRRLDLPVCDQGN